MWSTWLRSPSRAQSSKPKSKPRPHSFSCSSFKDVQTLCQDEKPKPDPDFEPLTPRTASLFRRIRISTSVLRLWAHRSSPTLPDGEQRVVIFHTSLRVVRRTFDDCRTALSILRAFRVPIDERDVSMDTEYLDELEEIVGSKNNWTLPMVFVGGRYIGGAEEVRQLNDIGELKRLIERLPVDDSKVCESCGGLRFKLCEECDGSHKIYMGRMGFTPCLDCNDDGLVRCPSCSPARRRQI
ncbi:hypothetical protein UlMin_043135 [Ulmus minor]